MIRNSIVALATAAALFGVVAPAMATPVESGSSEAREFVADRYLSELKRQGINATSVEEWGDYVRAFVTLEDGTQTMQFFTPGSLTPVDL
ncbi:MAG TPA: hypothetical protein VLZ53_09445 [Devosia sp.]|jgi:hypothetical protein|nr:hypothetical protein [Devosia sp.]